MDASEHQPSSLCVYKIKQGTKGTRKKKYLANYIDLNP